MQNSSTILDRALGGFLGLAIGDAVGATLEFEVPGTFEPISDMVGGGPFELLAGETTDDTAMALILARHLAQCRSFHPEWVMREFMHWSQSEECFDIGDSTLAAIKRYEATREPFQGLPDPALSGNGSIMRLYPAVLLGLHLDDEAAAQLAWDTSRLTHGSELVAKVTYQMQALLRSMFFRPELRFEDFRHLLLSDEPPPSTGFVEHTWQVALWGLLTSTSFKEGLLKVVNLGGDADTAGAVYGQLAGTWYGRKALPEAWVQKLYVREKIERYVRELLWRKNLD